MLGFKQFLLEVKRTPERAAKLGDYLAKREVRREPHMKNFSPRFHLPAWHKVGTNHDDLHDTEHDDHHFSRAWTKADYYFYKKKKNIEHVPVKELLKHNWQGVEWDGKYALNAKNHGFQDKRPINVARSRQTGKLHVVDGFHRLGNHWLRGETHIKANVQDVGYGKRKKKE